MKDHSHGIGVMDRTPCILHALIADFGGEATCQGIAHKLGRFIEALGVRQSETRAWVRDQLCLLEDRGDVTVEFTDSATLIARITKTGADRAAG